MLAAARACQCEPPIRRLTNGGEHVGKVGYYNDDEGDRAVVYFGEPIHSGSVLIRRDYLASLTSLEHERWKRAHPEFCRQTGIG